MTKPKPSRDWDVDAAGARGKLVSLSGEISTEVPGCPSLLEVSLIVGWQGTASPEKERFTVEKSAAAIVVAKSCATKGQTQSREPHRGARVSGDQGSQLCHQKVAEPRRKGRYG